MYSLSKGNAPVVITGNSVEVSATWKNSSGGDKGLMGKVKAAKGVDLDLVTVGLLGRDPKGICWFDDEDPFNNGSLVAGGDSKGRKKLFGSSDPLSREFHCVTLSQVPAYIDTLVFMVSAYKPGVSFRDVSSVTVGIKVDGADWPESRVTINSSHNTCVLLKAQRKGTDWVLGLVDELTTANSQDTMMAKAADHA